MNRIPLTQGKFALVDDSDYERGSKLKWHYDSHGRVGGYARRTSRILDGLGNIKMHQFIMGERAGMEIDHINDDKLDNRKENLRFCTHAENRRNCPKQSSNTSGYKGVHLDKKKNKWVCRITFEGTRIFLCRHFCLIKAAHAYDDAARKYFGEFARTNFALEPVK